MASRNVKRRILISSLHSSLCASVSLWLALLRIGLRAKPAPCLSVADTLFLSQFLLPRKICNVTSVMAFHPARVNGIFTRVGQWVTSRHLVRATCIDCSLTRESWGQSTLLTRGWRRRAKIAKFHAADTNLILTTNIIVVMLCGRCSVRTSVISTQESSDITTDFVENGGSE